MSKTFLGELIEAMKPFRLYEPNPNMRDNIWQDIAAGFGVAFIAAKHARSVKYISRMKSTIAKMQYPLRFENGKIACCFCGQTGETRMPLIDLNSYQSCRLVVHHNHKTGAIIGLICLSCNSRKENWLR